MIAEGIFEASKQLIVAEFTLKDILKLATMSKESGTRGLHVGDAHAGNLMAGPQGIFIIDTGSLMKSVTGQESPAGPRLINIK